MSTLAAMSIASEIARARREKGWTQKEFAQRCGVDQRTISQYETGKILPNAERLEMIAGIFGKEWKLT